MTRCFVSCRHFIANTGSSGDYRSPRDVAVLACYERTPQAFLPVTMIPGRAAGTIARRTEGALDPQTELLLSVAVACHRFLASKFGPTDSSRPRNNWASQARQAAKFARRTDYPETRAPDV